MTGHFLYMCMLQENLLFFTLILGSVFSDYIVLTTGIATTDYTHAIAKINELLIGTVTQSHDHVTITT